jgi:hypothetical protein
VAIVGKETCVMKGNNDHVIANVERRGEKRGCVCVMTVWKRERRPIVAMCVAYVGGGEERKFMYVLVVIVIMEGTS